MQHIGFLPSSTETPTILPLLDPMGSVMPEAWVKSATLVRMNSLIRGHSGVRWELIENMNRVLDANLIAAVPVRGSISASGGMFSELASSQFSLTSIKDLSPLSYIAGALVGNPRIKVWDGPAGSRRLVSSREGLARHNIAPIDLVEKEHLGTNARMKMYIHY